MNDSKALPCPFCGKEVDFDDADTIYPNGTCWREEDGERHYVRWIHRREGDENVWGMHCPESAGGCGFEMTGDSKADALATWNRIASYLKVIDAENER